MPITVDKLTITGNFAANKKLHALAIAEAVGSPSPDGSETETQNNQ